TDPVSLAARATSGSEGATEEFGSVVPAERSSLAAPAVAAAPLRIQVVDAEGEPVAGVRVRAHIDTGGSWETPDGPAAAFRLHALGITEGEQGMLTVTGSLPWEEGETTATVFAEVYVRQPPRCTLQREAM